MSKHGDDLSLLAEKNKVNLEYEASVAGGIPIIRSIKEGLIANKINKIYKWRQKKNPRKMSLRM